MFRLTQTSRKQIPAPPSAEPEKHDVHTMSKTTSKDLDIFLARGDQWFFLTSDGHLWAPPKPFLYFVQNFTISHTFAHICTLLHICSHSCTRLLFVANILLLFRGLAGAESKKHSSKQLSHYDFATFWLEATNGSCFLSLDTSVCIPLYVHVCMSTFVSIHLYA